MGTGPVVIDPIVSPAKLRGLEASLDEAAAHGVGFAVEKWARIKESGGKVVVVTGSGPNLHEGVSTQIAELVRLGLVDGVLTSSAVICHEMGGALERVKRIDGRELGFAEETLPADGRLEVSTAPRDSLAYMADHCDLDWDLWQRMIEADGPEIIKVAANLAYPSGFFAETIAPQIRDMARAENSFFEAVAGSMADPMTMIGACARRGVPCLVTVPQLVGGGQVGICIADSNSIAARSEAIARLLDSADLIIESGLALAQEIHDGPFELYTGHGLWSRFGGGLGFSLEDKALIRIDLDPALERAWRMQRNQNAVSESINRGKPKAAGLKLPFRMEMSGFCRLPHSRPIVADLGQVWPLMAHGVALEMGKTLEFTCFKQGNPTGEKVREFIVENIRPLDPARRDKD